MALAGAAGGAARASMDLLQQQMVQQQMEQAQQIQQQRAAIQLAQLQEQMRRTAVQEQRQGRQDQIGAAEAVTSALDTQFDPGDPMDVEVSPIQASQIAGTPSAGRLREIPTLNARPVAPGAGSVDQRPTIGVRRLSPTGEQRQARDTEQAFDALTSDPEMPASVRRVIQLQRRGVEGVTPEDVESPEAKAARLAAEDERRVDVAGRMADAQYGAAAAHRAPPAGASGGAVGGRLPAAMADKVASAKTSLGTLQRLNESFNEDFVGPAAGRYNRFERGAPDMLRNVLPDAPKGFEKFAALTATLKNDLIRAITGAAVSAQEQDRIMAQIPSMEDTPENWRAKYEITVDNLNRMIANMVQSGGGALETAQVGGEVLELVRDAQGRLVPKGGS